MKTRVVYFSKFGNTRQIAEAIAGVFEAAGEAQAVPFEQLRAAHLNDADVVIMGCPTYRMNLPEPVRQKLAALPKGMLRGKSVAAFDTSYQLSAFLAHFTAAGRLAGKLRKLKGKSIARGETFLVMGREGPLCEGEAERARAWAATLLEKTSQG